ncbi:MAG: hypothetical protein U0228_30995 [Myxococcaceae bacterium]
MKRLHSRDVALAAVFLIGLGTAALVWWLDREDFRQQQQETLAGLPPFPSQPDAGQMMWQHAKELDAGRLPGVNAEPLVAVALSERDNVAVIQVNALANTPFFTRLRRCLPNVSDAGTPLGLDWEHAVDRVALVPGGVAISGAFLADEAARIAGGWGDAGVTEYRGARVYDGAEGCVAQVGTTLLSGARGQCQGLVDRASAPTNDPRRAEEVLSSDVYAHTNLSGLAAVPEANDPTMQRVLDSVNDLTLRANVWDQAALTIDATPRNAGAGRGSTWEALELAVATAELTSRDDPKWSALMSKTRRDIDKQGVLHLDVAVPPESLLERLSLPCLGDEVP